MPDNFYHEYNVAATVFDLSAAQRTSLDNSEVYLEIMPAIRAGDFLEARALLHESGIKPSTRYPAAMIRDLKR